MLKCHTNTTSKPSKGSLGKPSGLRVNKQFLCVCVLVFSAALTGVAWSADVKVCGNIITFPQVPTDSGYEQHFNNSITKVTKYQLALENEFFLIECTPIGALKDIDSIDTLQKVAISVLHKTGISDFDITTKRTNSALIVYADTRKTVQGYSIRARTAFIHRGTCYCQVTAGSVAQNYPPSGFFEFFKFVDN